jgi:hypothetical protein
MPADIQSLMDKIRKTTCTMAFDFGDVGLVSFPFTSGVPA